MLNTNFYAQCSLCLFWKKIISIEEYADEPKQMYICEDCFKETEDERITLPEMVVSPLGRQISLAAASEGVKAYSQQMKNHLYDVGFYNSSKIRLELILMEYIRKARHNDLFTPDVERLRRQVDGIQEWITDHQKQADDCEWLNSEVVSCLFVHISGDNPR